MKRLLIVIFTSMLLSSCGPRIVTDVVKVNDTTYEVYSKQYLEGAWRVSVQTTDKQYSIGDTM